MPMQNHMQAKIRDNKSISYAWIFARLFAQIRGKRSTSDAWILAPCLAPVRRKMFISYVWILALLLLHIRISGQDFLFYLPASNYCTCFSFVWRIIYTQKRIILHTKLHLHYTQTFSGKPFLLVLNCFGQQGS